METSKIALLAHESALIAELRAEVQAGEKALSRLQAVLVVIATRAGQPETQYTLNLSAGTLDPVASQDRPERRRFTETVA